MHYKGVCGFCTFLTFKLAFWEEVHSFISAGKKMLRVKPRIDEWKNDEGDNFRDVDAG